MTKKEVFKYCVDKIRNVSISDNDKDTYLICGNSYSYSFDIHEELDNCTLSLCLRIIRQPAELIITDVKNHTFINRCYQVPKQMFQVRSVYNDIRLHYIEEIVKYIEKNVLDEAVNVIFKDLYFLDEEYGTSAFKECYVGHLG